MSVPLAPTLRDDGHSQSSNDGNLIAIGAGNSNAVFAHERANCECFDMLVNQPLFDSEDNNRKFGHSVPIYK